MPRLLTLCLFALAFMVLSLALTAGHPALAQDYGLRKADIAIEGMT